MDGCLRGLSLDWRVDGETFPAILILCKHRGAVWNQVFISCRRISFFPGHVWCSAQLRFWVCVKVTRGIDGFPLWQNLNHCLFFSIPNRIQKGGHRATHPLRLWLIFCAFLQIIHSGVLHLEKNAASCWQGCLQSHLVSSNDNPDVCILMWPKPCSQKERVRLFQMPACIYHTWDCKPAPV